MKQNTTDSNRKKRYLLVFILLLIVCAFGIEKCTEDMKEQPSGQIQPHKKPLKEVSEPRSVRSELSPRLTRRHRHVRYRSPFLGKKGRRTVLPVMEQKEKSTQPLTETSPAATSASSEKPLQTVPQSPEERKSAVAKKPQPSEEYPHRHLFRIGVHGGVGYTKFTGLEDIAENFNVRPRFTTHAAGVLTPCLGFFATWQYGRYGTELNLDYSRFGSRLTEYKEVGGITERTKYHYDVLIPQFLMRMYVYHGLYMGVGAGLAIPLGGSCIDFDNDRVGSVYRQESQLTEKHLRNTIKSRPLFLPTVKIGYVNVRTGLELGLEYSYGINDFLHTCVNDYSYNEYGNHVHFVNFTVGYSIPLNK